jgi:hypothetical protein
MCKGKGVQSSIKLTRIMLSRLKTLKRESD